MPTLVRGLDYYTGTVFEIYPTGKTGSQDALAAGGRYDRLVEDFGGPPTPAIGFAIGVERVLTHLEQNISKKNEEGIFLIPLGENAIEKGVSILMQLRSNGFHAEGNPGSSLKSQMRLADSLGMRFCIIIGDDEIKENVVTLRDLKNQSQKPVPFDELIPTLRKEIPL